MSGSQKLPDFFERRNMKNKTALNILTVLLFVFLSLFITVHAQTEPLADGIYSAVFTTDSSMFNVNEAMEGRGILAVKDGEMSIHVTFSSKNILNLFPGLAEDAQKEGAELLEPSVDQVTYSDGFQDEAYGFDIPVPYLDEEFDLALIGKKGKWYDHKVSVSDPVYTGPLEETAVEDGTWLCEVTLEGGSGKASVESPAVITVENGSVKAQLVWSSKNYQYLLINEVQYDKINEEGNSTFEIPVVLDTQMSISALTTAMSQPHLVDYTLFFDSSTLKPIEE